MDYFYVYSIRTDVHSMDGPDYYTGTEKADSDEEALKKIRDELSSLKYRKGYYDVTLSCAYAVHHQVDISK